MKFLALYLPAFHRVKENDMLWGEGFTEWDNVKKAKSLYKGHIQPMTPFNEDYYDLSKKECIEKQIDLANEYKLDGFIFYHYWLNENHMVLEKPAEILKNELSEKKIEYCFCWANHDWIATWHGKQKDISYRQEYGKESDWHKHIEYLMDFFKDERYIKIDGRPVLFIYNANKMKDYEEMIEYWNTYLKEHGMKEIYTIEYIHSKNTKLYSKKTDGVVEFEPLYSTFFDVSIFNEAKRFLCKKVFKCIDFQNYDNLWKAIIKRKRTYKGKTIFKSCFSGWDNSPRKERESMIVKNGTPEKFEDYLDKLVKMKRKDTSSDYLIINAWNEWGEGAMLEPSEQDGYKYLEAIKSVVEKNEK